MQNNISIILPAKNEASSLQKLLPELTALYKNAEIIIVNDGSTDNTIDVCKQYDIKVINHPYPKGNGAAIKSGARAATGDILVFMDADGQHLVSNIELLLAEIQKGYEMVVGSRAGKAHASMARYFANTFYNILASWVSGQKIDDLTSGFRAIKSDKFNDFLYLLPNGFSYPTTITMAFFRSGFSVKYVPVNVIDRIGKSHIKPLRDGLRFLLIIFKIGTLYTPLKFFAPISVLFFFTGVSYYAFTFITQGRFTNMSAVLFITAVLIFLLGLISEQLTTLLYKDKR